MVARAALIFALIAAAMLIGSVRTRAGGSGFIDIAGHPFAADFEWLWESGITGGCAAGRFCPDAAVTREEMASFLVRAIHPPATTQDFFTDDAASAHQADITGTSDVRWDDDELNQLKTLHGADFEVVDTTGFVNG